MTSRRAAMTDRRYAVVYGELLLRLDPPGFQRIVQTDTFEVRFTGAEANAGVSLVNFGIPTRVVSRVPDYRDRRRVPRLPSASRPRHVPRGARRRAARALLPRDRSGATTVQGASTTGRTRHPDARRRRLRLADDPGRRGLVPLLRDGRRARDRAPSTPWTRRLTTAAAAGVTVSCDLNYRSMLWGDRSAGDGDGAADGSRRRPARERGGRRAGVRRQGERVRRRRRSRWSAGMRTRRPRSWSERFGFRYVATTLARQPFGVQQLLGGHPVRRHCRLGESSSTRSSRSSIVSARATRSRAALIFGC